MAFGESGGKRRQRLSRLRQGDSLGVMRSLIALLLMTTSALADVADDLVLKGRDALRGMDIPAAMAAFDMALQQVPGHAQAAYERGRILLKIDETALAIADFTTATISDPGFGLAFARRGEAHMVLKNPEAAFKDFEAAIAASPLVAEVFVVRATYRFKIGNLAGAKADMESALKVADETQKPALEQMLSRMR
jgi:tetratricopeptide (TPR) repeat protein